MVEWAAHPEHWDCYMTSQDDMRTGGTALN